MLSRRSFLSTTASAVPALLSQNRAEVPDAGETSALPAPILALRDRRGEIHPITPEERASRHERARELMQKFGLDAILCTTGASLFYFTGARWSQSERLFAYVLPRAAAPFVICPALERDHLAELLPHFPEAETTLTYQWQENQDPFVIARQALQEVNISTGTLGLDDQVSFRFANALVHAAPALKIVSGRSVTAGCRAVKSPAELALLRLANQITLDVYRAAFQSCHPGQTSHEVEAIIRAAYTRCGVRGEASCNVGAATATPHGSAVPQTIREGAVVTVDDGCSVEGYTSDITRSWVYGSTSAEQRHVFETVRAAQAAALQAARPGTPMEAVDAAARKVVTGAGFGPSYATFLHRIGHGIGLDMHEEPYLVGGNKALLAPGMVFSNEPGIYLHAKFGIRTEDCMVITEAGADLFTPAAASLEHPFTAESKNPASGA